ncbi:insulinase family protein [Sandaracinobacter sp. RS1-74]|uniref:M16 family metallopeptidase n=1 Tax=Sandaracinobacteroides sayramensis TaxID=2913411 RepID=UPI001EDB4ED4|nr:pitrilysin family protein [Sandaracinobacteroides sayramensis]MCG2842755.1 insulinase family protein [Sandaracinobacteroides sayramensis]
MTHRLTRLDNGLTIVSLAMPGLETAALSVNADVGARNESAAENGLAHLYEHMVFKGTGSRSARAIAEAIEDVGGSLNAWTSRDTTCFHARVLAGDVPLALDLLADLLTDASFTDADLALEREVVLSEIGEALETPDDLVFDHLQAIAFPGQSLGRSILGTGESLAALDAGSLRHWRDTHYRGEGLIVAAAGKVDHDALVEQAGRLFAHTPAGRPGPIEPARWSGGTRADAQKNEQLHVALGFQGFGPEDKRFDAARLFAMALGGGMSSRLFQELREERGLAYSVSASHALHADTGLLSLYAAARPKDGAQLLDLARRIANDTAATLTPAELNRARAQLKAAILMGLESCSGQADWLGGSLITWGRVVPAQEVIETLNAVSLDEVRAAGAAMLQGPPALAVVGPKAATLAA